MRKEIVEMITPQSGKANARSGASPAFYLFDCIAVDTASWRQAQSVTLQLPRRT